MSQSTLLPFLENHSGIATPVNQRHLWKQSRRQLEQQGVRSTPLGRFSGRKSRGYKIIEQLAGKGLRYTGLEPRGRRNALNIELRQIELTFANLPPAFDGYRLMHLSDLHLDMLPGLAEAICERVRRFAVDICVMTGDYRADEKGPHQQITTPMQKILDHVRARDGCFATLGNHDDHAMVETFEASGLPVLVNESTTLQRSGEVIHLTGLDDVNRFYTPMSEMALAATPAQAFKIALVHSPEMAQSAAGYRYSLYLCGHTHGGQVCLPGGRAIVTHLVRNRSFSGGIWRCDELTGYTSTGAGVSGIPVRFFSRGEITLFTLRRSHNNASADFPQGVDLLLKPASAQQS